MNTSPRSFALALAACSFAVPSTTADDKRVWLQVTPAGSFGPRDGRPMKVPAWYIDAAVASAVIQRVASRKTPPVLDYEHQTLNKEANGQPAPAAGWFRDWAWREGEGLFAQVELTTRALQYIQDGEYRYFSPVFLYDAVTGHVTDVQMGALTNNPAVDGMQALSLRAAATFGLTLDEDLAVNPLLLAVIAALGLAQETTQDQAIAALTARQADTDALNRLRQALNLDAKTDGATLVATCTALKAKAEAAGTPDPAKFVPVDVVTTLQQQVAVLTSQVQGDRVEQLIQAGLADGRLLKPMEVWARDLGQKDVAALSAYLDAAAPVAALTSTQTGGQPPVADPQSGLTADEQAVCTAMGLTAEQFNAAKRA